MKYRLTEIAPVVSGTLTGGDAEITQIVFDSRLATDTQGVLFAALTSRSGRSGNAYIPELRERGVRAFLTDRSYRPEPGDGASYLAVDDPLQALHELARWHRSRYRGLVAAVTGSNGKTVVKEWISQLWNGDTPLFRSPKSYNSQLGVPLSLLMTDREPVAVIEAGISRPGEMEELRRIIRPDITVLTNIGEAHRENFTDARQLLREKLELARDSRVLVFCGDDETIRSEVWKMYTGTRLFAWGYGPHCDLRILGCTPEGEHTRIRIAHAGEEHTFRIPFTDEASIQNIISVAAFYAAAGFPLGPLARRAPLLQAVAMRLEIRKGLGGGKIINDVYNSDLSSLAIALNHLANISPERRRAVILSDIYQSGYDDRTLYGRVAELLRDKGIDVFVGIGPALTRHAGLFEEVEGHFFENTDAFLKQIGKYDFAGCSVLLKGCRDFCFEKITHFLEPQIHTTTLEVDLNALSYNLNRYRSKLNKGVRCMAMVKALSYGSGSVEVAEELQRQHIDFLAVAYTDEGVTLRDGGIETPIVVLNSETEGFASMIEHRLEPEIYDFASLDNFIAESLRHRAGRYPIHVKFDTGMHRLGFSEAEIPELVRRLCATDAVYARTVFSHFTSSDEPSHDAYTLAQIELFGRMSAALAEGLGYPVIRHLCNSAGIERFPQAQFDMVRLGIGLYGISPTDAGGLKNVTTLRSTLVQIREYPAGNTVGYMRRGVLGHTARIATLPIGYADGLRRALSCGNWSVSVNGKKAPIVGNICMDACMIDVTDIDARPGDRAVIFGDDPTVQQMAEKLGTIPYEVLTDVSARVKRIYIKED